MNSGGYRINGSIGFSISAPPIEIYFEESENIEIIDKRKIEFTTSEKARLEHTLLETINRHSFKKKPRYIIYSEVLPHHGFGSNTAIYMSFVEALFILNSYEYSDNDVIVSSGRGGTSGIGINTYFNGGFIFDAGIKNHKYLLNPSSIAERDGKMPLVLQQIALPEWRVGICIPEYIQTKSEQEEIDFFDRHCPIDGNSVNTILYESVFGITSSIIERDYDVFCKSVNTIQSTKWKYLERIQYGAELIELENKIRDWGADCVGMSSFGPMLFFTGKNVNNILQEISRNISNAICHNVTFNNQGRIINYD